jgi:site-specific DNA-methyltransferase (adenine-specific)
MAGMDPESVDSVVTDPPYGLKFMGKAWDHGVPGVEFWEAAIRVAKPGAHLLAFGGTRTFHRLACAIEDAGWELRDTIMWVYGSGFPKSLDISKAIDKAAGAEREVVGIKPKTGGGRAAPSHEGWQRPWMEEEGAKDKPFQITAPATDAARKWDGWGTALKPAWEPIIVARKPLDGTVAANVLRFGTGAINVDGCRVDGGARPLLKNAGKQDPRGDGFGGKFGSSCEGITTAGRWPANLVHDGSEEVQAGFPDDAGGGIPTGQRDSPSWGGGGGWAGYKSQTGHADQGSAARFFYCAKASKQDRDEGLEGWEAKTGAEVTGRTTGSVGLVGDPTNRGQTANPYANGAPISRNHHPTVKPTDLMRWLVRLVTAPGGLVLDPFMGSGSTGKAAMLEGFRFAGADLDPDHVEIARARIAHSARQGLLPFAA